MTQYAVLFLSLIIWMKPLSAAHYNGRMTFGSYVSQEKHDPGYDPNTSERNDFAVSSMRLFFNATNMGRHQDWSFLADIRDKHDFFSKLDSEKQRLTGKNSLQAYQVFAEKKNHKGFLMRVGRFTLLEAGSVFTDGAFVGWKKSTLWKVGAFAGFNPKERDQSFLTFNSNAHTYGLLGVYQYPFSTWRKNAYYSNALVFETYKGTEDRRYFYQHFIYQWNYGCRLFSYIYWDFVPSFKVQNANVTYNQRWTKRWRSSLALTSFDVIEYKRHQDVREQLAPSPYRQITMKAKFRKSKRFNYAGGTVWGMRIEDGLQRQEIFMGADFVRYFSKYLDAYTQLGYQHRFTNWGPFIKIGAGYFSRKQEYFIDLKWAEERQTDGTLLHPFIVDVNASYHLSKRQFFSFSLQSAQDERVGIGSFYFKYSYRFGDKEIPPIRDGAAPMGRL
ncbi:MAG: hypothetical protein D6797_07430 [Bdellovibrio sp.]|nr:MAG: hypothetical protein D6797_07430 [Bdellovibrio sp.]